MNANRKVDTKPGFAAGHLQDRDRRGFTLIELLVVLATLGVLAAVLLPAMASTQPRSKAFQCLNNMRQLTLAWTLNAAEDNDKLAYNGDFYRLPAPRPHTNWVAGIEDWNVNANSINTNTLALTLDSAALLAKYCAHLATIYHCPADVYASPPQRAVGWPYRVRSVSMSCALGDGLRAPEFSWALLIQKTKMVDLLNPTPAKVWVFADEAPDSINDNILYFNPDMTGALTGTANGGNWIDFPASYHNGSGSFSFADGHVELHKWQDRNTCATTPPAYTSGVLSGLRHAPDDVGWLATRTPLP